MLTLTLELQPLTSYKCDKRNCPRNTFPRLAKVVSRMVWHFRAWRKSFPEGFDLCRYVETTRNLQSAEDRK